MSTPPTLATGYSEERRLLVPAGRKLSKPLRAPQMHEMFGEPSDPCYFGCWAVGARPSGMIIKRCWNISMLAQSDVYEGNYSPSNERFGLAGRGL